MLFPHQASCDVENLIKYLTNILKYEISNIVKPYVVVFYAFTHLSINASVNIICYAGLTDQIGLLNQRMIVIYVLYSYIMFL